MLKLVPGADVGYAAGVTNTSFTARCRRFDENSTLGTYYGNWIAVAQSKL